MIAARLAAVALAALVSSARADDGAARLRPWTRGPTPALAGAELGGRSVDLRELRGKVVLVQFWASWCEPCEAELAALAKLRARLARRPLEIVTVNYGEGRERVEEFARVHRLQLPVLLDRQGRAAEDWGVGGLPMSFLVDAAGQVRWWAFGELEWSAGEGAAALDRLLAEAERPGARSGGGRASAR